jgi:hypothetical protein
MQTTFYLFRIKLVDSEFVLQQPEKPLFYVKVPLSDYKLQTGIFIYDNSSTLSFHMWLSFLLQSDEGYMQHP